MAITANWNAVSGATGYKLYRKAGSKIDLANLPADVVSVAADATSYTYPTSVANTLYYLVVGAVGADGVVTYGDQYMVGYYPDTGPGPQTLLRGDWTFGYFGEVAISDLVSQAEIYAAIYAKVGNAATSPVGSSFTTYHKCIVAGRIVFITDNGFSNASWSYNIAKSNGLALSDYSYETNGVKIAKNGFEVVVRIPHGTAGPLNAVVPTNALNDISQSELGMIFALFGNANVVSAIPYTPGQTIAAKYRLADATILTYGIMPVTDTAASSNTYLYSTGVAGGVVSDTQASTSVRSTIILELLF